MISTEDRIDEDITLPRGKATANVIRLAKLCKKASRAGSRPA
jgi:hypothetical protein